MSTALLLNNFPTEQHGQASAEALSRESSTSDMDPDFEGEEDESTTAAPSVLVEPEVPDPFIVDDGEDSSSSESDGAQEQEDHSPSPAAEDNIALAQSTLSDKPVSDTSEKPLPSPNTNKAVPPPPTDPMSDEDDEEEPPELYLPGLIIPTMFLPIPNVSAIKFYHMPNFISHVLLQTDPLTTLLTKFIPPERRPTRDLTGQWHRADFHVLVVSLTSASRVHHRELTGGDQMTNSWRAIARMARDRLVSANPEDLPLILSVIPVDIYCVMKCLLTIIHSYGTSVFPPLHA